MNISYFKGQKYNSWSSGMLQNIARLVKTGKIKFCKICIGKKIKLKINERKGKERTKNYVQPVQPINTKKTSIDAINR